MIKKRRNLFIMLVVIVLVLSATVGVIVASSNGTRLTTPYWQAALQLFRAAAC